MQESLIAKHNIHISGKGNTAILFIHGYGCDQTMWRFVAPAFENEYKVVLLDLVGCGYSDPNAYEYDKYNSLDGHVTDILEICDALNQEDIILVGHSVSAMIAGLAAIRRPDLFQKLIMVCPSPRYINEESTGYVGGFEESDIAEMLHTLNSNYLGWTSAIAPVIIGRPDKPEFTDELINRFCRNNPAIAEQFATVTFTGDNRKELPLIKVPALILQCSRDIIAPMEVGQYVHEHIAGSTLSVINTSGHCPHLTAPELTLEVITDFLMNK